MTVIPMIAACRDIDPARLTSLLPDQPLPPIYPGAIPGVCAECDVAVSIGPRQQLAISTLPAVRVLCFVCAAKTGGTAVSLGNPYKPKADGDV